MNYLQGQHPRLVMGMNIRDGASNQRQSFGQIIEIWLLSRTYSRVSNHVHRISLELPRINEKDTVHRLSYIKMYLHIQATVYRLPRTSMFLARSSLEGIELLPACEFCRSSCIFLHLSVRQLTTRAPINQLSSFWWPRETPTTLEFIYGTTVEDPVKSCSRLMNHWDNRGFCLQHTIMIKTMRARGRKSCTSCSMIKKSVKESDW